MKVLWITNSAIGRAATDLIGLNRVQGGWMLPFLDVLAKQNGIEVTVVTSSNIERNMVLRDENVTYYIIPGGVPIGKYNGYSRKSIAAWRDLINAEKPDIIHIWGCESSIGIAAILASDEKIPAVVYIQGLGRALNRFCEAGIDRTIQWEIATIRDFVRLDTIWMAHRRYGKMEKDESFLLNKAKNIIVENEWCNENCKIIAPKANIYRLPLSIDEAFFSKKWGSSYEKYTVMCPLAYAPIKGLHMLIQALGIVKKRYPNVKLRLPGYATAATRFPSAISGSGYKKFIKKLITENDLKDSVEYLGLLSAEEMAENMLRTNVFVMCSAIENHSSTLKEAMALGVPCVASNVGGISEYAIHNQNALIYRFEEYELLAKYICDYFGDDILCQTISSKASNDIAQLHHKGKTIIPVINIYSKILADK